MSPAATVAWRVFPWDPKAREGMRWSPTFIPPDQGEGRFDLPFTMGSVLYLAETPDHAVAEWIQGYRGQLLEPADLVIETKQLALVGFTLTEAQRSRVVDLCEPGTLVELDLAPDRIASRQRHVTQGIAATIHAAGWWGLRWWSAFFGEWHTVVLFSDRLDAAIEHSEPEPLAVEHPAVVDAARALGIVMER